MVLSGIAPPPPSWLFDSGPLPLNSDVTSFETQSLLMLTSVNGSNIGLYTCVVNDTDEGIVDEESSSLTVAGKCSGLYKMLVLLN